MKSEEIELIISEELFRTMIENIELKIYNKSCLNNEIKYNLCELNFSLNESFNQILFVLQTLVDSYYLGYYEISGFMFFSVDNVNEAISHNSTLLENSKKLIKFIN